MNEHIRDVRIDEMMLKTLMALTGGGKVLCPKSSDINRQQLNRWMNVNCFIDNYLMIDYKIPYTHKEEGNQPNILSSNFVGFYKLFEICQGIYFTI